MTKENKILSKWTSQSFHCFQNSFIPNKKELERISNSKRIDVYWHKISPPKQWIQAIKTSVFTFKTTQSSTSNIIKIFLPIKTMFYNHFTVFYLWTWIRSAPMTQRRGVRGVNVTERRRSRWWTMLRGRCLKLWRSIRI